MLDVYLEMGFMGVVFGLALRCMGNTDSRDYVMILGALLFGGLLALEQLWSGLILMILLPLLIVLL